MTKHETNNDEFKASGMLHKGVRLPDSSAEAPVMGVERSGRQSSHHVLNSCSSNIAGTSVQQSWQEYSYHDCWTRINLRTQEYFAPTFQNRPLPNGKEAPWGTPIELDGPNAPREDKALANRICYHA